MFRILSATGAVAGLLLLGACASAQVETTGYAAKQGFGAGLNASRVAGR